MPYRPHAHGLPGVAAGRDRLRITIPTRVAAIADFIRDRFDEEERDAGLFHELGCPIPKNRDYPFSQPADERGRCECPTPIQLLDLIESRRQIVRDCEQQTLQLDPQSPDWLLLMLYVRQALGALALPYELHPDWREEWRP